MPDLNTLSKVNESITINRYNNGWMVEIGGRDKKEEWIPSKLVCTTEVEVLDLIKQYNALPLVN